MLRKIIINISLCVPAGESAVVQTQQTVMAAAGGEAHLSCQLSQPKDVSEITWKKIVSGTGENVAFNSQFYGERVVSKFRGRVQISSSGVQNSSIVVRNVSEEDEGCFLCLFNAFPEGALKGRTCLLVYELDQPLLHVRASAAGSVISCSATGRPPPNVTLTVGQQHLHSYNCTVSVNANSTFTVTAAAVLPGPGSTNTQVGCSAAVFSGPQLTASSGFHYSFPHLHCMAHQLYSSVVTTTLHISLILKNGHHHTSPPFLRHLLTT
uniref:Ig-like domain-containing protein n=1 Tax=Oryzias melastigma TaxID=30732 RepID=A0A3B3BTD6_ORYME